MNKQGVFTFLSLELHHFILDCLFTYILQTQICLKRGLIEQRFFSYISKPIINAFLLNSDRKIKTIRLSTNINLNQRYGKIGHTLQSVSQLFVRFQPKYNWVYQYVVNKNVSLKKYLSNQFESLGLYLVDSLFKIVDKYQNDTQNKIFNRLICQKVFGRLNKNKKIENMPEQFLEIIEKDRQYDKRNEFIKILKKAIQQKQIQKHNNDNKITKDKKKKQQQKSKQQKSKQQKRKENSKQKRSQKYQKNNNKKEKNNNRQSIFMVIDDEYDNDEQLLGVQFEIIQKTEMKKMLIFQSETLRGLSQDDRMKITQREIVHMIEKVNLLNVSGNINECDNNRDNDNNQVNKRMNKGMSKQQLLLTPPRGSIFNNNELNSANANNESVKVIKQLIQIYQSYRQEYYQTDEVKQFQTVLLKLIIQGLLNDSKIIQGLLNDSNKENTTDNNNKDIHNVKLLRYNNRLEQINSNIKANQNHINTLKLILTNNMSNCQHQNHSHNHIHSLIINQINTLQQQVINYYCYYQNQIQKLQQQQQLLSVQKNKQSPKKKKSLFSSNKDNSSDKKKQLIMQDTIIETQNKYKQSNILLTKIKFTLSACVYSLIEIIKEQKIKQQKVMHDRVNNSYQERVFMSSIIIKLLSMVEIIQSLYYTQCNNKSKSPQNNTKNSKYSQNYNKLTNINKNNTDNFKLILTTQNQLLSKQEITGDDNTLLIPTNENHLNKIISVTKEQYQSTSSQLFKQQLHSIFNMSNNNFTIDYNGVNSNKRGIKSESNLLTYQYQSTQYRNNSFTQLQRNNSFTQLQRNKSFTQLQRNKSLNELQKQQTNNNTKSKQAINTTIATKNKQSKISSFIGSVFGKLNKKKSTQQNHDTTIQQQQRRKQEQTKYKRQQQQYLQKVQNKRKSSLQEQLSSVSLQNLYQKASLNNNNNQNNNKNKDRILQKQSKQIQLKTLLMLIYQMIKR